MSVTLRLTRVGGKKKPFYRVIATDSRMPRDGRFIEIIGHYNPRTEPSTVVVDAEKARLWLSRGAKPTSAVEKILSVAGIIEIEKKTKKPGRRTVAARLAAKEAAEKKQSEEKTAGPEVAKTETVPATEASGSEADTVSETTEEEAAAPAEEVIEETGEAPEAVLEITETPEEAAEPASEEEATAQPDKAEEAETPGESAETEVQSSDEPGVKETT